MVTSKYVIMLYGMIKLCAADYSVMGLPDAKLGPSAMSQLFKITRLWRKLGEQHASRGRYAYRLCSECRPSSQGLSAS